MIIPIDENLQRLADSMYTPLYIVGGYVRNFLIGNVVSTDIDVCSNVHSDTFCAIAQSCGFKVVAKYNRTGTVVIECNNQKYEYSQLRSEKYIGGEHTPYEVTFGVSLLEDAKRRDFKCNAIYYDIKNKTFVDPLGGLLDVKNKVLSTVTDADSVFSHDGLRLMRLARFCGELGFEVSKETFDGAKKFAYNIKEISVERILAELNKILVADSYFSFSPKNGHYNALKTLDDTRVLDYVIPELTLGRGMSQRSDYHNYDVLEHSLRCVLYADKSIRMSALLHDVGKPAKMLETGKYYAHQDVGEELARNILTRLKTDKKTIEEVCFLTKNHMLDMDCKMRINKVKLFIAENVNMIDKLFAIKNADYRGCKDAVGDCPTVLRWKKIYEKMKEMDTPFSVKDLKITAKDLIENGYEGKAIGEKLEELKKVAIINPTINDREKLLNKIKK